MGFNLYEFVKIEKKKKVSVRFQKNETRNLCRSFAVQEMETVSKYAITICRIWHQGTSDKRVQLFMYHLYAVNHPVVRVNRKVSYLSNVMAFYEP